MITGSAQDVQRNSCVFNGSTLRARRPSDAWVSSAYSQSRVGVPAGSFLPLLAAVYFSVYLSVCQCAHHF